jgi:hypothetical protein
MLLPVDQMNETQLMPTIVRHSTNYQSFVACWSDACCADAQREYCNVFTFGYF